MPRISNLLFIGLVCIALRADRVPEWDQVFKRSSGWTGGDAVYSVDLRDGRVLWLFADSWIGPVIDGKHAGARLVNNAIAVHQRHPNHQPPAPATVQFYWGDNDTENHSTAWVAPNQTGLDKTWYWVADGAVAKRGHDPMRLVVFLWHMGRKAAEGKGVWNFQSGGGGIALVDNYHEAPHRWNVRLLDNPHADSSRRISWGGEVLALPP